MADQEPQLLSPEDYEKLKAELAQRQRPQSIQVEPQPQNTITGSAGMFPSAPRQTFTPETADALVRAQQTLTQPDFDTPDALVREGQRQGIPLNRDRGVIARSGDINWLPRLAPGLSQGEPEVPAIGDASPLNLLLSELHSQSPSTKAKNMGELMGLNIEVAPNGDFIARDVVDPKTGRTNDVAINPRGFGTEDVIPFVAGLPANLAEGALAVFTRGKLRGIPGMSSGLGSAAATGIAMGLAPAVRETIGGAKDYMLNVYENMDPQTQEIVDRRVSNIKWSAAFNLGGAALGSASKIISPFAQDNQDALRIAREALNVSKKGGQAVIDGKLVDVKGHGVEYVQFAGEETGSPNLRRHEIVTQKLTGGGKIKEIANEQVKQRQVIEKAYVGAGLLSDADMGEALKASTLSTAQAAESAVEAAEEGLRKAASTEVQKVAGVNILNRVDPDQLGGHVRDVIRGDYATKKEAFDVRYETFLTKPEIRTDVDVSDIIKPRIKAILDDLPSFKKEVTEATGLFDQWGNPQMVTKEVEQLFDKFVPQKFISKLEQLLKAEKVSVKSVKELRTSINDDIAEGISIPGTSVKRLNDLKEAANESIEKILEPTPTLLAEWKGLGKDYTAFKEPFDNRYIRKIMVPDGEVGGIENAEIIYNLVGGGGASVSAYRNLEQFFGKSSPKMAAIRNAMKEKLVDLAVNTGGTISVGGVNGIIDSLDLLVGRELFTPKQIDGIRNVAKSLNLADKLDSDEVRLLMRKGTLTGDALKNLATEEKARAALMQNKIFEGTIEDENPVLLAKYLLRPETNPRMVEEFVRRLDNVNPTVRQEYAKYATEDMIQRMSEFSGIERALDPTKMVKFFRDPETKNLREVYRLSMGDGPYYGLERFAKGNEPAVNLALQIGDAGGMAKTMEVTGMSRKPAKTSLVMAQRFILSALYTSPGVRKIVTNPYVTPERANAVIDGLLVSAPAVEYLTRTYGDHAADVAATAGWLANQRDTRQSQELHLLAPEKFVELSNSVNRARAGGMTNVTEAPVAGEVDVRMRLPATQARPQLSPRPNP